MGKGDTLLEEYRGKRDFSLTPEPQAKRERRPGGGKLSFVVQKHDATRLHFDFRLEWDGVLKSWAVTRGPSLDPSEKRLAVRTEDHPMAYGEFEGVIPPKQYGGGTVMLWDRGHWEPENDPEEGLKEGKLSFTLHGERMKGSWALVRMKPRKGEKRENWLLIKHKDEVATARGDITRKYEKSVASNRTMNQIAKGGRCLKESDLRDEPQKTPRDARRTKATMPRWREPQLATLVAAAPEGGNWLSELKYDGYRTLIAVAGGKARIFTRNGKDWTDKFPGVAEAAAALDTDGSLVDGEIVAFDGKGRTDFSTLQKAIKQGGEMSCFVFDLIIEDGKEIIHLPLAERKARLEKIVERGEGALVFSDHVRGSADKVFAEICRAGHEGIVAKRADAPYRSGRGKDWLKVKCTRRQEFVVGGYSPTAKKARPFSSVLIGVQEEGELVYKGRVGSFAAGTLEELAEALASRARKTSPFAGLPREASRGARFVTPDLVVEVDFTEFTSDGYVRHGVVRGIRADKDAAEVVLEEAGESTMAGQEMRDRIAGVKLSSPEKVLFAEQGVTKADLAAHYERVAERMLPLVEGRLVSLVRCPEGEGGQCFFQRHGHKGFPAAMKGQEIAEKAGGKATYLRLDTLSSLIAGVQMGTLEFHIWGSRGDMLEKPDRLVFDLDPDEGLGFGNVKQAAFDIRDELSRLGLEAVPLVTGGKGIHVVVPLTRRAEWPEVKAFARGFARMLADEEPDRYVAQASKARRKGRIFVDWLRNERGATAIALPPLIGLVIAFLHNRGGGPSKPAHALYGYGYAPVVSLLVVALVVVVPVVKAGYLLRRFELERMAVLVEEGRFEQARDALLAILERHGIAARVERANPAIRWVFGGLVWVEGRIFRRGLPTDMAVIRGEIDELGWFEITLHATDITIIGRQPASTRLVALLSEELDVRTVYFSWDDDSQAIEDEIRACRGELDSGTPCDRDRLEALRRRLWSLELSREQWNALRCQLLLVERDNERLRAEQGRQVVS
jgi:bifunctional non-homologous end joining protein LigD